MGIYITKSEMKWQDFSIPMTWDATVEAHEMIAQRCLVWEGKHGLYSALFRMPKGGTFAKHTHPSWIQTVVLDGQLKVETEKDGTRFVRSGECYIIEPGEVHTESSVEDSLVLITQPEYREEFLSKV